MKTKNVSHKRNISYDLNFEREIKKYYEVDFILAVVFAILMLILPMLMLVNR